jgi:hypothetical protein
MALTEIKARFTAADLLAIDAAAAGHGLTRAEYIRRRVTDHDSKPITLSTMAYHRLVTGAMREMRAILSRHHTEHLIAYVIAHIGRSDQHQSAANTRRQSPA